MDSYQISAKHYDQAYAAKEDLVDLPFYLDLAQRIGGPVLEIGCGTGRVLLPTGRAGIEVHGVDNSAPMLQVLRRRLEQEAQEVRDRSSISEGDMRTFRLHRKYPLVTIPFRPMQHMYTVEDQVAAFQTAALHLREDGILAFDVFYPKFEMLSAGAGKETLELEWQVRSRPDATVRRFFRKDAVDKINQTFSATFLFRTYEGERLVEEEAEPLKMSYYTYPHLRALFLLAGLEVVEEYGSFAKARLDNSAQEMIFLLRKTKRG
jgi:SAM-dependent methyltransferase